MIYGKDSNIKFKSKSYSKTAGRGSTDKIRHSYVNSHIYLNQISLTGGIPFAVTLPNAPSAINADLMTAEKIRAKLQEGFDDLQAGKAQDAASAFKKFRENHKA